MHYGPDKISSWVWQAQLLKICQFTLTITCTLKSKQNSLPVNTLPLHISQSYCSSGKKGLLCSC